MSQVLSVTEIARKFAEYINRVAYRGEHFILTRGNKPIAELRPVPIGRKLSELPGLFASLPHLSPDDVDAFAHDVEDARETLDPEDDDPWER